MLLGNNLEMLEEEIFPKKVCLVQVGRTEKFPIILARDVQHRKTLYRFQQSEFENLLINQSLFFQPIRGVAYEAAVPCGRAKRKD